MHVETEDPGVFQVQSETTDCLTVGIEFDNAEFEKVGKFNMRAEA